MKPTAAKPGPRIKRTIVMLTAAAALIALPTLASARPSHRGKAVRKGHRVHVPATKARRRARRGRMDKRFARGTRYAPAKRYYRGRRYRKAPYGNRYTRRYRRPIRRVRVAPIVPRRVKKARFCYANPRHPVCRSHRY